MNRRLLIFVLATTATLGAAWFGGCALVADVDDVFLVPKDASLEAADTLLPPNETEPEFDTAFDTAFLADLLSDDPITFIDTGADDTRTPPVETGVDSGADTVVVIPDTAKPKGCPPGYPTGRGPVMAKVDVAGGSPYCIDTTEVTNEQLNVFLVDGSLPYDTHPACSSFKLSTKPVPKSEPENVQKPANGINYCYALAFCRWSGKRLCGKIGGGHASGTSDDSKNEWFHACSNGLSVSNYPYGAVYNDTTCNTEPGDGGSILSNLVEVKSKPLCHGNSGGHALVFDMSGNVAEFDDFATDHTTTSTSTSVHVHGGFVGISDPTTSSRCRFQSAFGIGTAFSTSGFRCCADYVP